MVVKLQGHDGRTSREGSTALQAALDYRPEVILLDIGLPGRKRLSGGETTYARKQSYKASFWSPGWVRAGEPTVGAR